MRFLRIASLEDDLEPKCMGILEPKETLSDGTTPREDLEGDGGGDAPLDLLLMPGLAFDAAGNRLGRGGGFYDAFIQRYWARCEARGWTPPPTLALAYAEQVLEVGDVPMDPHDRPVDALATPDGVAGCTEAGTRLLEGR
jgi:5-formyltetrahydrofolate cyclo-ligase